MIDIFIAAPAAAPSVAPPVPSSSSPRQQIQMIEIFLAARAVAPAMAPSVTSSSSPRHNPRPPPTMDGNPSPPLMMDGNPGPGIHRGPTSAEAWHLSHSSQWATDHFIQKALNHDCPTLSNHDSSSKYWRKPLTVAPVAAPAWHYQYQAAAAPGSSFFY